MAKAAVPNYMTKYLNEPEMAPGHRFGLFFPVWENGWRKAHGGGTEALKKVTTIANSSKKLAESLQKRQQDMAVNFPNLAYFPAKSVSPLMTGIGNEHPLENGFAFLNPYGLPYYPGSSVKGVLRTAAEELALGLYGESGGWDMLAVWWLFGFEAVNTAIHEKAYHGDKVLVEEASIRQKAYQSWVQQGHYDLSSLHKIIEATATGAQQEKHKNDLAGFLTSLSDEISLQGALHFWDVYPQSKNLAMDILTPHHGGYFNGKNEPHDSEQPNPNVFLTIPSGSQFDFYCTCTTARLPEALRNNWQNLLSEAFQHAFDWLGFGAKTAVGYGQMTQDKNAKEEWRNYQEQQQAKKEKLQQDVERENRLAAFSPLAQEFIRQMEGGNWQSDKNAFLQGDTVEKWLEKLDGERDESVLGLLIQLFGQHIPGLLQEPDKVQGKKQKPVFSDRQRKLAKHIKQIQVKAI